MRLEGWWCLQGPVVVRGLDRYLELKVRGVIPNAPLLDALPRTELSAPYRPRSKCQFNYGYNARLHGVLSETCRV
jgi:hypothetical protein